MDTNFKNAKYLLEQNGEISGRTVGKSMIPLFRSGKDIAIIKKIDRKLKVNDVLLYRKKDTDEFILHRLIKIDENGYVIRGDNRYSVEKNITDDDIIGVMTAFKRNGKYYECGKSIFYRIYVFYIRASYPFRRLLHKFRSFIKVIKWKILKYRISRKTDWFHSIEWIVCFLILIFF